MSGGGLSNARPGISMDTAQVQCQNMMDFFNKSTLADMRALSFDELTQMTNEYADSTKTRVFFSPVIDNYVLTGTFSEMALKGEIADIPYIIGYTANDLMNMSQAVSDFCALRSEQSTKPAYAYFFQRQLPGDESGAFHSADLWYIFHSFKHSWRPFTRGDEELSLQMVDYWTNFAKYGDPNGQEPGIWTPYTKSSPEYMLLDANEESKDCKMSDTPVYLGSSFKWR
jgi:para-nitrobenzyl esterase